MDKPARCAQAVGCAAVRGLHCSSPESTACCCTVAPSPPAQSPRGSSAGPSAFPTPRMREETLAHLGHGSGTEGSPNSLQTSAPQSSWLGAGDGLGERGRGVLAGGTGPAGWGGYVSPAPLCFLQLKQKSSRVERCLPYLEDAQANLRQEAVKFIGEPRPRFPVWALPWQQGAALWALKPLIVPPGALCLPQPPAHAGGPGAGLAQALP